MEIEAPKRDIYSISRLNREVRELLDSEFPLLWVEGEISNFSAPSSGHWYFSLKDRQAQVRCAMFRGRNNGVRIKPKQGMQVLIRARISLYEPRGDYQLVAEHMEEVGDGALQRAFEELKTRLDNEGLFDPADKQALPEWPRKIGLVTSPSGAAIRDIVSVFERRFPAIELINYPTAVQGADAASQIVTAIQRANHHADCDAIIVTRGGGSLEDLWCFNDERVARAIHASQLPVVSAVGHEIDFTIADFVADVRAPTPSAAAELLSPDQDEIYSWLEDYEDRLWRAMQQQLDRAGQKLAFLQTRLQHQHPGIRLQQHGQRLDELEQRLQSSWRFRQQHRQHVLRHNFSRLQQFNPASRLPHLGERVTNLGKRLQATMQHQLHYRRQALAATAHGLNTISPLATLERGYSITYSKNQILRSASQLEPGDTLETRLASGSVESTVTGIRKQDTGEKKKP